MSIPKVAASLSSGLLARKGLARPAMRRQPVSGLGPLPVTALEDFGWNDMGDEAAPAPSPVAIHLAAIQETLERKKVEQDAVVTPLPVKPKAKAAPKASKPMPQPRAAVARKSAFTLRIDAERHLRLRLLSAITNQSAQHILISALDTLLAQHPDIAALAEDPKVRRSAQDTGMEQGT